MYSTYKYYDQKGRRLSVFCRFLDDDTAEIYTLTCSKKDQFSKNFAVKSYKSYINNGVTKTRPLIKKIERKKNLKEISTLIDYCNDNYFKKRTESRRYYKTVDVLYSMNDVRLSQL